MDTQYKILIASTRSSVYLELISSANLLFLFEDIESVPFPNALPILSGSTDSITQKSKIKQILLDKSLGQILKVDRPIESIQKDEDITPLKSFSQHFHTTAGREFVSIPCFKTRIDQNSDSNWKFIRPRTPSISFNCKPRVTIFDEKRDISQQQGLNISLSWEPIQKPIPLNKQTKRKPWFTLQVLHDPVADYQKPKPICFVNYTKATYNKERPKYNHQIDDGKVAQTPNFQRRYIDFSKLVNRKNASPSLIKF